MSAGPTAVPNLVQIVYGGLLCEWVKFIYTFFGNLYLQVRPIDGFSRLMAKTTRTCERVSFGGFVDVSPHFEGEIQTRKN